MSGSYRDLQAWQKAIELVSEIYSCTAAFPKEEIYGLNAQLGRVAVSIPSNIAAGEGRSSDKEFALFLHHARGSVFEVETQLTIANRLGFLGEAEAEKLCESVGQIARMLNGLISAVSRDSAKAGLDRQLAAK